jgi:hypothetical protein
MRTIVLLCAVFCAACSTPPDKKGAEPSSARATKKTASTKRTTTRAGNGEEKLVTENRPVPRASDAEIRDFQRIWELYRRSDRRWPLERDRFKVRSEAAGYLLAGHLLRHYMTVNAQRDRSGRQLVAVKDEIVAVGEPCVAPLVNLMVLERVRADGDNYFVIDDLTRQDCIDMLERIGAASVPELIRTVKRMDVGEKGRRLAALALGGTKDPRAFDPLVELLRKDPSWQVRADAATALAKLGDGRAVRPLTDAIQKDEDPAVVKRAGKARYELLKSGARR